MITRSNAAALMPEEVSREIVQGAVENSSCLQLLRRLPNMSRSQTRMPVLSGLPSAYFVGETTGNQDFDPTPDTSMKKLTQQLWGNKYIDAAEAAVIIAIPEAVLDDADYDIWGEVKPRLVEAFGVLIDGAILFSTSKPTAWPAGIVPSAIGAGNSLSLGDNGDLYDDIMGEGGVIALVEEAGFMVNGHLAAMSMRGKLRGLRSATDELPIFQTSMQAKGQYTLDGESMIFPRNGAFDTAQALMVSGDWKQAVYAVRQDMTYKILDQAVIQDTTTGEIIHNLAQQDMVALRAVMRLGWQVPNPINRMNLTEGNSTTVGRYPFAVLRPAGS